LPAEITITIVIVHADIMIDIPVRQQLCSSAALRHL